MTQSESDKLGEMLDDIAAKLSEHFEAVQIVASQTENEGTRFFRKGRGNWFARLRMCSQFAADDWMSEQASRIAEKVNPPDESESWKN